MRDANGNILCEVCKVPVYLHMWTSNRPEECQGGAVVTDEDQAHGTRGDNL